MTRHCYLFALEIEPLEIGKAYDELPQHCTLMHRFWSSMTPEELTAEVRRLFGQTQQVLLTPGGTVELGPRKVRVSEIEFTTELETLHTQLYQLLNKLHVEYTAPEWVGAGYKAHSTERENSRLISGQALPCKAVYLIEAEVPGREHQRIIREKFTLYAATSY